MNKSHSVVMWSGGTDSTFLVLNRLLMGGSVTGLYVSVLNNATKTEAELAAIRRMCAFFEKMFPGKFHFRHIAKLELLEDGSGSFLLKQPLLWMLPAAYFVSTNPSNYNEVCIGYILKDDAISWLEDFKGIWKSLESLTPDGLPHLTFPLSKINKDELKLPSELEACRVFCERPKQVGADYEPCGVCYKCNSEGKKPCYDDASGSVCEQIYTPKESEIADFVI